jgi:hypothetical protein
MASIFTIQTPDSTAGDATATLGTVFTIDSNGYTCTAGRYYNQTDIYNGTTVQMGLWAGSTLVASGSRLQSSDPAGFITVPWTTPVNLTTGVTYTVGFLGSGYTYDSGGLSSAVDNAPLHSVATGGRYDYGASLQRPTSTTGTNFFADVVVELVTVDTVNVGSLAWSGIPPVLSFEDVVEGSGPGSFAWSGVVANSTLADPLVGTARIGSFAWAGVEAGSTAGSSTVSATQRILTVAGEDRILTVAGETRTITIPPEA